MVKVSDKAYIYQPDYNSWHGHNPWTYQSSSSGYYGYQQQPSMPSMDLSSPFALWLSSEGISDPNVTVKVLINNGISCKRTLSLLTSEDIHVLGIQPLGQRRLLEFLKSECQPGTPASGTQQSSRIQPQTREDPVMTSIGHLLGRQDTDEGESVDTYIPPFATVGGKKHKDITEFVRCFNIVDEKVLTASDEGMQLLIHGAGSGKPKLEDVSPLTWMGASLRILRELIKKGDLDVKDLDHYLTYMEKISDLSSKYTWASLRMYDREFRRWQAQTGVSWTQDNTHLAEASYLFVRQDANKPQAVNSKQSNTSSNNQANKLRQQGEQNQNQICRQFNFGECQFGAKCRYQHVCLKPHCQQAHAVVNHNAMTKNTAAQ